MPYYSENHFAPLVLSKPNKKLTSLKVLGMDKKSLLRNIKHYYTHRLGRDSNCSTTHYPYMALSFAVRDRLMERWISTQHSYDEQNCRRTYYLSLEFLMGRSLGNAMLNLDIDATLREGLLELGLVLEEIAESEPDAGLGNGGLGRLAACFLDSCATLQLPVKGYGIRYQYGMFRQHIENGYQVEDPDHWLRDGNPWEVERQEFTQRVSFGGHTEYYKDALGLTRARWVDTRDVLAVPFDTPVPGFRNGTVNTLRLWQAAATDEFDLEEFNAGSYTEAVGSKNNAENITMVLYPNDSSENGKELRLKQQYFLASASLKDVLRKWKSLNGDRLDDFAAKNCFQLNDTHPTVAVAELMRLLLDEERMDWDSAWSITSATMAYTNHTLLPEALEKWPLHLFRKTLPRHYEIICEINERFLDEVRIRFPGDNAILRRMSLIDEDGGRYVRMAHLAVVGSFAVNGVAALHTELVKSDILKDFYDLWPEKFRNKTNGVTPRRLVLLSNPTMSQLIDDTIGRGWVTDMTRLRELEPYAEDKAFRKAWRDIKRGNKEHLIREMKRLAHVDADPASMFDVQVKRIHEYKRQHLNLLHVISLYKRLKDNPNLVVAPRTVIFGGKAAPGYRMAKLMIRLATAVADIVGRDPAMHGRLQVIFFPNYNVKHGHAIFPAADLSEQISLAGKEASGTGNMKFQMNGALTIGTLDGANVEIIEQVGEENFFLFGMTTPEVKELRQCGYRPRDYYEANPHLREVIDLIGSGFFTRGDREVFRPLVDHLLNHDEYMLLADFQSYVDCQEKVSEAYLDYERWSRMSILNVARSGFFSSDRAIQEYCEDIWRVEPVRIELTDLSEEDMQFKRATAGAP